MSRCGARRKLWLKGLTAWPAGNFFYQQAKQQAEIPGTRFGWKLVEEPGVAHSNRRMALAAAPWVQGESASTGE
jgi:hypothetical protein